MNGLTIPMIAVRVIIENDNGAVLVLKRANTGSGEGLWCLPGGKVDYGQTLEQAAVREVFEETQLTCLNQRFLFFLETLPTVELPTHYITFYFTCAAVGTPVINEESSAFAWIHPHQMHEFRFAFLNDAALQRFWEQGN